MSFTEIKSKVMFPLSVIVGSSSIFLIHQLFNSYLIADAPIGFNLETLEKIGLNSACLIAVIFLWMELKKSREDFIKNLQESVKSRDDLAEKRLQSDEKLSKSIDGMRSATDRAIDVSMQTLNLVSKVNKHMNRQAIKNRQQNQQ